MNDKPHVILTEEEITVAAIVGVRRHCEALKNNRPDNHGFDGLDGLAKHIEGACGEMAAAKVLNRYYGFHVNTFKGPDIGSKLQVRTRSSHSYDLIVRPNDDDEHAFLLVTGVPPEFIVHGWMWGREAKQDVYLVGHGGRPEAYFVPQKYLHKIAGKTDG